MTQRRIQDFGSPIVASSLKKMNAAYAPAGVLKGFEFLVDSPNRIRVAPGAAVTNQGVIIIENEAKFLSIVNSSTPADYTIYYEHADQDVTGGVSAALIFQSGLLTADVVSGVILGYVRYPGGAAPLSSAHFVQSAPLQLGSIKPKRTTAPWLVPVKSHGYMATGTSGGVITLTDTFDITGSKPEMYLKMRNNSLAVGSLTLTFPFKVMDFPYSILQMVISTDINASIVPSVIDSQGNTQILAAAFTGSPTLVLQTVAIPRTLIQTSNTLIYLQLQMSIAVNKEAKIQAVGLNTFNLPV